MNKSFSIALLILITSCGGTPEITADMLDGDVLFDPSLYNPNQYLVSYANPTPDALQAQTPVLIVTHGYTATTFEWDEFRNWNNANGNQFLLSQVLLGGHGRTYEEFKNSTW
ncbi:MAG: esterase, partial [Cyclobacteriaceae bacterium]|nr:esterase [Cyclobacteriaceae bacterium]